MTLAPDGSLWVATDRELARYDGQRWTYPYATRAGVDAISVARDGTVFAVVPAGPGIWRLPARP